MKNNDGIKWWFFLPFEQAAVGVLLAMLAPALWALYDLYQGNITRAAFLLGVWLILFAWLAFILHKRRKAHFLILFVAGAIVLAVGWYVLKGMK